MNSSLQVSLLQLRNDIQATCSPARMRSVRWLCPTGLTLQADFNNATFERVAAEEAMGNAEPHFDVREARFDAARLAWNSTVDEFNAHLSDCIHCHWQS